MIRMVTVTRLNGSLSAESGDDRDGMMGAGEGHLQEEKNRFSSFTLTTHLKNTLKEILSHQRVNGATEVHLSII